MLNFDLRQNCYGCGACFSICPHHAIQMRYDEEGFAIPYIQDSLCINCGACEKACPFLNPFQAERPLKESSCFAVYLKDSMSRQKSTSGGVFYALAQEILKQGGLVAGCVWNEKMEAVHILTDSIETVEKMRGSKYVQSQTERCFQEINAALKSGRKILFTGTPCQVGGLLAMTGNRDNLFTCALICEGVPSPKVWGKYVEYLEHENGSKLTDTVMRYKGKLGWEIPLIIFKFANGRENRNLSFSLDQYIRGFFNAFYMRNSCFHCQYKSDGHNADIITGDFWGAPINLIEQSEHKGLSAVLLHSQKGEYLFQSIGNQICTVQISFEDIVRKNQTLIFPLPANRYRESFFHEFDSKSLIENIQSMIGKTPVKIKIIWILYHTGLYSFVRTLLAPLKKLQKK